MGQDTVSSYTGFRTVTKEEVNGVQRILLVRLDTGSRNISKGSENLIERLFQNRRWHAAPLIRNAVLR